MNTNKTLVIMRGLPWTGKTFTANQILNERGGVILSTDDYFYKFVRPEYPTEYSFDHELLDLAHHWNRERARQAMEMRVSTVIIDNTNTTSFEMRFYVAHGKAYGYNVEYQEPTSITWETIRKLLRDKEGNKEGLQNWASYLANGSELTHGVPYETILKMMNRWETTP